MQVHRAERAVVETVAGLALLAPDHAAMIRPNRTLEPALGERAEHAAHVDVTALRGMRRLLERLRSRAPDVAAVREVDALSPAQSPRSRRQVDACLRAQRIGAERDAVC